MDDPQSPTAIVVDGVSYGAAADDTGAIGGGAGYRRCVTAGDFEVTDLDTLLAALAEAQAGQVVFIPADTEIDMTARIYIEQIVLEVPAGVTLAGERGHAGHRGALLTSDALKTPVMIRPMGPDVRITGIRLQGPNPKRYMDHHSRSFDDVPDGEDGHAYYYKLPTSDGIVTTHPRLEVDNCEISAFAHAGVFLRDGGGHRVHHCAIHHCQYNGLGYGVCHDTASSLIEYNLFDWNRHSIAGSGRPGSGFTARHNVELGTSLSHCFDMHGGRDRKDGTNVAGAAIEICYNTFRAPQTPVMIRGVPADGCLVHHNWFLHHLTPPTAVRAEANSHATDNAHGNPPNIIVPPTP
jgi:hypothetical protein